MGSKRPGVRIVSSNSVEISFTYRGERCRERIKCEPNPTVIKKIKHFRIAILSTIENGTFEYHVSFPNSKNAIRFAKYTGANTTVKQYLETWVEAKEKEVKASTFVSYERIVRNQIVPEFGKLKLAELTRIDVKNWCMGMDCGSKRIRNARSRSFRWTS